ncbi:hypothetical protein [Bradyrhizobium sp. Leo170]|uniref:hypothetical protein n=1 Tax=Bradyrhizobium sp. Leo170 TaxID=1571199 RepID=UPI00102E514B|nr:hypothetical protein [Bradyrhizobium sp. Leo170]
MAVIKTKDLPPCPDFTQGLGTVGYLEMLCRNIEEEQKVKPAAPQPAQPEANPLWIFGIK